MLQMGTSLVIVHIRLGNAYLGRQISDIFSKTAIRLVNADVIVVLNPSGTTLKHTIPAHILFQVILAFGVLRTKIYT